jgi:hypothetical protein
LHLLRDSPIEFSVGINCKKTHNRKPDGHRAKRAALALAHNAEKTEKIQMCFAAGNSVSIGSNLKNRSPQKRPLDFTFLIFSGANTESRGRRSAGQLGKGGSTPGRFRGQMHASQLKRATRCFAARIRAIVERKVIASVTW